MELFDRKILNLHQARADKTFSDHNHLTTHSAHNLLDRVSVIKRCFKNVLVMGRSPKVLIEELKRSTSPPQQIYTLNNQENSPQDNAPSVIAEEEALPFKWPSFDLILANLNLHWINDLPGFLWQVRQSLQPDGVFIGSLFGDDTLKELRQSLSQAEIETTSGASPRVSPFVELASAASLLTRAQFTLPVADRDRVNVTYSDAYALMKDQRGMGETNILKDRVKTFAPRALFQRMSEIYQQNYTNKEDRITSTFDIIYLTGWAPHDNQQTPLARGSAQHNLADFLND